MARLHVFGDSHAIAYEGGERGVEQERRSRFAGVEVHHLGPALAFNLARDDQGTPGKWGLAIEEEISRLGADVAAVLLVFGEIDIRAHCVKHALAQQASVREAAAAIARRHYAFARRLAGLTGVPVFCAGPVASAKDFSHQYPLIGSEVERNYATCVYNELLSDWCADTPGVYFFSAHSRLMTPDLETRSEYFGDGCHLNHRGIDLVIEAFKRTVAANGLDLPDFFRPRQDLLRPEVTLVDIAPRCRVLAVSSSYHKTPVKALWGTPYFFHTTRTTSPISSWTWATWPASPGWTCTTGPNAPRSGRAFWWWRPDRPCRDWRWSTGMTGRSSARTGARCSSKTSTARCAISGVPWPKSSISTCPACASWPGPTGGAPRRTSPRAQPRVGPFWLSAAGDGASAPASWRP